MERGKYIVIEGNDGTGKSTQVDLLAKELESKGIPTYVAHEPSGTPVSDAIRTIIKDGSLERTPETNLLLFTAARREIWQRAAGALAAGTYVLSARNYLSTIAYQGRGEGLNIELIEHTTKTFTDEQYMHPDHTIILLLDDQERKKRIANRGDLDTPDTFESRDISFQQKVNAAYLEIAEKHHFPTIDASQSIEAIQAAIQCLIDLDGAASRHRDGLEATPRPLRQTPADI